MEQIASAVRNTLKKTKTHTTHFTINNLTVLSPSPSLKNEEKEKKEEPTSVRIPFPPPEKSPHIIGDLLRDAGRKHDAAEGPLAPRLAKGAPLGAPRGMNDETAFLSAQRRISRLREQRREQRSVARERRERNGFPRRARNHLHSARLALAFHLSPHAKHTDTRKHTHRHTLR